MSHLIVRVCVAVVLFAAAAAFAAESGSAGKVLRHVVAIKFKEGTTPDQIKTVEEAFRALKEKIPQVAALEWGLNNSPEGRNKGFTHCFVLSFKTEEDRAAYLPHPAHKAFGAILRPVMDDVFVLDYWSRD
jgi:hypothetical protein